jgi:DNA-binding response OmpR family regulator
MKRFVASPFDAGARGQDVLIVDDDSVIRKVLLYQLENAGYRVWSAESAQQALAIVDQCGLPHLAIVDVMMPGMNGLELCERLLLYSDLPVIMLTAVSDEETLVRSLLCAEDYIIKPFRAAELLARVQRVLRRMPASIERRGALISVDSILSIDFVHQRVMLQGRSVDLTPTETKLLYILFRNAGRPLPADFLMQRLWPAEDHHKDAVRVNIYRLRRKIEPDPSNPHYILTERELGYYFAAK